VETTEIVSAESIRHKGDMFSMLDTAIVNLATKLSSDKGSPARLAVASADAHAGSSGRPLSLVVLPAFFTGGAAGFMLEHQKELDSRVVSAVGERGSSVTVSKNLADDAKLQANIWSGLFEKTPDQAAVWQQARSAGADLALMVSSSWDSGTRKSFSVYLYDVRSLHEFRSSGAWAPQSNPPATLPFWLNAVQAGVRDVLTQYEAAAKRKPSS
jgi:hypothetical protein